MKERQTVTLLANKIAMVFGAGQTPGATVGNGRATAMQMAREGATVWCIDRDLSSAEETTRLIECEGFHAYAFHADIAQEKSIEKAISACMGVHGRIDVLHNNVGIATGDAPVESIRAEFFDQIYAVNLRGMVLTCKHVLPIMRTQSAGAIVNISSAAARNTHANVAYKTTKAAVLALTQNIAVAAAHDGVRANCILPGVIETPMAVEAIAQQQQKAREEIAVARHARVPLRARMGTAWDIAHASVFLASDRAGFITGVCLPVDGGSLAFVGR